VTIAGRPERVAVAHTFVAGWAETTIVVRFWLIAGMFVALGLWIFYRGGAPGILGF